MIKSSVRVRAGAEFKADQLLFVCRERVLSPSVEMEAGAGQVRLRVLSPQVRLEQEEMEVPDTTTVRNLKTIILTRLQGQPTVKVGSERLLGDV